MTALIDLGGLGLGLEALQDSISDEWLWFDPANKRRIGQGKVHRLHCTVFARMSKSLIERAKSIALATPAFEVVLGDVFFSQVNRLKPDVVFSVGVAIHSSDLLAFKARCLEGLSDEDKLRHDPYAAYSTGGHMSLAYIREEFKERAEAVAEASKSQYSGKRALIHSFEVTDSGRTLCTISFAVPPPS